MMMMMMMMLMLLMLMLLLTLTQKIHLEKRKKIQTLKDLPALIARRAIEQEATFGPTKISSLPANDNFYISADGEIVFAYQPYEIASYAQGFINVPFFPYELAEHMTPAGLAIFGLDSIR